MLHIVEDTVLILCSLIKSSGNSRFSESCFDIINDLYSAAVACPHSFIQSVGFGNWGLVTPVEHLSFLRHTLGQRVLRHIQGEHSQ